MIRLIWNKAETHPVQDTMNTHLHTYQQFRVAKPSTIVRVGCTRKQENLENIDINVRRTCKISHRW